MLNTLNPEIQERLWNYLAEQATTAFLLELQELPKRAAVTLPVVDEAGNPIVTTAGAVEEFLLARQEPPQTATNTKRRKGGLVARALENRGLRSLVAGYKVIDIEPASVQFHASYQDSKSYDVAKMAPNVAPPFDRFIVESSCPQGLEHLDIQNYALVMKAVPFDPLHKEMASWMYEIPKWNLQVRTLFETSSGIVEQPFTLHFYVYKNGSLATPSPKEWGVTIQSDSRPSAPTEDRHHIALLILDWFMAPAFFALALLHCKGVELKTAKAAKPLSKKVMRRRGGVVLQHHVIEIKNQRGEIADGVALENAARRGLHIVRGHFSTYTEASPLFGRITGTFWVPAHVRGSISEGLLSSEYRVMGK